MPNPPPPRPGTEEEAREDVEARMVMAHEFTCACVKKVRGKWVRDALVVCDCGADAKASALLADYRLAVLTEARRRVEKCHRFDHTHDDCAIWLSEVLAALATPPDTGEVPE